MTTMKSVDIQKRLPKLARLGVQSGITCGVPNLAKLETLATVIENDLVRMDDAKNKEQSAVK